MRFRKALAAASVAFTVATSLSLVSCDDKDDTDFEKRPLWPSSEVKNKIVVISDLHLGVDDSFAEIVDNRKYLINFLKQLQSTQDVKELVINGDFLDEWYLPFSYTEKLSDDGKLYEDVLTNNHLLIEELNHVIKSGIKLTYVVGNHDMTVKENVVDRYIPGIQQVIDAKGLGTYYAGDKKNIAIEHSHRYDVFSAPDTRTNEELCGNKNNTILPAGFFYAINAAQWVIDGSLPIVDSTEVKKRPIVEKPSGDDDDLNNAYTYYKVLNMATAHHCATNIKFEDKAYKMHFAGFDDDYSLEDFFPKQHEDGIYAKLYKNLQRTWELRQEDNKVNVKVPFATATAGALSSEYFAKQANDQHLNDSNKDVDVVVFGHTHMPDYYSANGKLYINSGTWVDAGGSLKGGKGLDNKQKEEHFERTFAVITTGETMSGDIFTYHKNGTIDSIKEQILAIKKNDK